MSAERPPSRSTDSTSVSSTGVRSVERAIDLLQALNQQAVSTIDDLCRRTGLPKATIARLLRTFESRGLVAQSTRFGAYHLASGISSLTSGYDRKPQAIEAAIPVCDALTRHVKWPITLALFDVDAMVVRYSTIAQSPLSLLHSSINLRRSLVGRALGRAYLAFCSQQEREFILASLKESTSEEDRLIHDLPTLLEILKRTRKQGYALRDPEFSSRSCTLAIPVMHDARIVATLGLSWFSSVMQPDEAVRRYLAELRGAARQIAGGLTSLDRAAQRGRTPADTR